MCVHEWCSSWTIDVYTSSRAPWYLCDGFAECELCGFESLEQSDVKIYLVLINSNFTYHIVHKYVLIVCELASLLLDTLNLVKDLGYCIVSRQISSGTNACENTQTRLCSVVRASLVILLCPCNWVAGPLSPAKESVSSHWALSESSCVTLSCMSYMFQPCPTESTWDPEPDWDIWKHTQSPLQENI